MLATARGEGRAARDVCVTPDQQILGNLDTRQPVRPEEPKFGAMATPALAQALKQYFSRSGAAVWPEKKWCASVARRSCRAA